MDGRFGKSNSKTEAKTNGGYVGEYVPSKKSFNLLDGTEIQIDTAWAEISFTYNKNKKIFDSRYGYNFAIPFHLKDPETFTFNFHLVDTSNQMFTNGREKIMSILNPKELFDTMKIFLEQKDPDTSKGWTNPIITDTIIFKRISYK